MSFISKVELKYQLQKMGINIIEGNYVRKSEIDILAKTNEYPFYRVSNSTKGNKATEDNSRCDPYGVYLFIKDYPPELDVWYEKRYKWDAKFKKKLKLLDLSKMDKKISKNLFSKLGLKTFSDIWNLREVDIEDDLFHPEQEVDYLFPNLHKEDPTEKELQVNFNPLNTYRVLKIAYGKFIKANKKFTRLFSSLGYEGIIDSEGGYIFPGEPQVIVFDPQNVIWSERQNLT